jgi:hypothetical protein
MLANISRFFKRSFFVFFILIVAIFCFKGPLYRAIITYQEVDERPQISIKNPHIQQALDHWTTGHKDADLEQIIHFTASYCSKNLLFTLGKCSMDPNQILMGKNQTNCVGYSASLHAILSYILAQKGWTTKVKSEHKVGQLYFFKINLHQFFKDPAFKDHDYNVITDLETKERYVIDPTVRDYFGVKWVRER